MKKQWYILEMDGFTEEEAQEFLNDAFALKEFGEKQGIAISHLTEKGVTDLKRHVFKEDSNA